MLEPIICFYKNSKFLYSKNYIHLSYNNADWEKFLTKIEKKHFSKMKILKINFEAGLKLFKKKPIPVKASLYEDNLIDVFILNDFKILNQKELNKFLKNENSFILEYKFKTLLNKKDYKDNFIKIKEDIKNGLYYQVNYTLAFKGKYRGSSLSSFNYYHNKFKGNYHALLPLKNGFIVSCSPELFLSKNKTKIISEPIKGTSINNEINVLEMLKSKKEDAELSMIVDLVRNDFNSVADIAYAKVNKHRSLLYLDNLVHTYSKISAKTSLNVSDI